MNPWDATSHFGVAAAQPGNRETTMHMQMVKIAGNDLVWGQNYLIKKSCERSLDQVRTHEYQGCHTYADGCITGIFGE